MSTHPLTVELPIAVFEQLKELAQQNQSSPESLALQSILALLPQVQPLPTLEMTWEQMQQCSQADLLQIAQQQVNPNQQQRHTELLQRNQTATLTAQEQLELQDLRLMADRLMLRKAYAWDILGERGYPIPALEELPLQEAS